MAMNRAEKAAMQELRVRAALSWPAPPPRAVTQTEITQHAPRPFRGWSFNVAAMSVKPGFSTGGLHGWGDVTGEQYANRYSGRSRLSMSQGAGGPWYWTRLDALRALHWATARRYAEHLAALEAQIDAEILAADAPKPAGGSC